MTTNNATTQSRVHVTVITGGSRGLGKSMALRLADQGIGSVITYRSAEREAHDVVSQIEAKGQKAAALRLDVADSKSFDAFAKSVGATLERVWGRPRFEALVNNAGMGGHGTIADTTEAMFDELMNTHLKGPFFLTQKLLPLIADGGRIINITTGLTRFSFPGYAAYASMKGGLEVLTRYMAKELGARGISVNSLAPGAIETDFGGGAVRDNAGLNQMIAAQTALGRVGLPDDIGNAVAALLASDTRWINGQRIEASGGMTL